MIKKYTLSLLLCVILIECFGQSNFTIPAPFNLQAVLQDTAAILSWETPVDTSGSTDTIPAGLIGFRIYSNNTLAGTVSYPEFSYIHNNPDIPVTYYKVTALYNLSFYGFPDSTAESAPSNLAFVIIDSVYNIPFTETFSSTYFETNQWIAETSNWVISQIGNPVPGASFREVPIITNYSSSLTSAWLNSSNIIDGRIYLSFDLTKLSSNQSQTEFLYVDVFDGNEWVEKTGFIASYSATDWVYERIDITNEALHKPFKIRFRAEGANSNNIEYWAIDNIEIFRKCMPPLNLESEYPHPMTDPCLMKLSWNEPTITGPGSSAWLSYDNGQNDDAIGLTSGGTFSGAIRFTADQLNPYDNFILSTIRFYPVENGGLYTLKVWSGANASQLRVSQPVPSYVANEWNEVLLNTPFTITNTDELWIGFEITHPAGIYIAGVDDGYSVEGYGDMISLDGVSWESYSAAYNLPGNWNLQAYASNTVNQSTLKNSESVIEYRIYRQNEYIGSTSELFYLDNYSGVPWPIYYVTALYADCESEGSNIATIQGTQDYCNVGVKDIPLNSIEVFPNPAKDILTVNSNGDIVKLILVDMMGRQLKEWQLVAGTTNHQLNISSLKDGIYCLVYESIFEKWGSTKIVIHQ